MVCWALYFESEIICWRKKMVILCVFIIANIGYGRYNCCPSFGFDLD